MNTYKTLTKNNGITAATDNSDAKPAQHGQIRLGLHIALSVICVGAYFFIAQLGKEDIASLLNLKKGALEDAILFSIVFIASLTTGGFFYRALKTMSLRPTSTCQWLGALTAPLASLPFFTAGYLGAQSLDLTISGCVIVAVTLFLIRSVAMVDASVKFPQQIHHMRHLIKNKKGCNRVRLFFACLISLSYTLSLSDAMYSGLDLTLSWAQVNSSTIPFIAYPMTGIGCLGTFPFALLWITLGIDLLTNGGNFPNNNTTDKFVFIGFFLSFPNLLGVLGSTNTANNQVFGRLGNFSKTVRLFASFSYALTVNPIAFSSVLRDMSHHIKKRQENILNDDILDAAPSSSDDKKNYPPLEISPLVAKPLLK